MKKLLIVLIVSFFLLGKTFSQIYTPIQQTTYGQHNLRGKFDSVLHVPRVNDTLNHTTDTSVQIRVINGDLKIKLDYWRRISIEGIAGSFLPISDTAAMLTNYMRKGFGVKYTDTSAMLSNRLKISDTTTMLSGYAKAGQTVKYADTSSQLSGYQRKNYALLLQDTSSAFSVRPLNNRFLDTATALQLRIQSKQPLGSYITLADSSTILAGRWLPNRSSDTATALQSRIQSKQPLGSYLNVSDTSTMLSNRLKISDTANMLSNRLRISDTATMLSNRLKISDTTTMLANRLKISDTATQTSGYVRKGFPVLYTDSSSMLSNLVRKTDTASMLLPYHDYYIHLKDWGADPTGATDSYTAFVNAISAAKAKNVSLFIDDGVYLTSNTISVDGFHRNIFANNAVIKPINYLPVFDINNSQFINVNNLRIVGAKNIAQKGIYIRNSPFATIANCQFDSLGVAIHLDSALSGTPFNKGYHVQDCIISNGIYGINNDRLSDYSKYSNVRIYRCDSTAMFMYGGNFTITNPTILQCNIGIDVQGGAIFGIASTDHGNITGGAVNHNEAANIVLRDLVYGVSVTGVDVYASGSNNYKSYGTSFGIFLQNAKGVVLTGNSIGRNKVNIGLDSSNNNNIIGNNLLQSQGYTTAMIKEYGTLTSNNNTFSNNTTVFDGTPIIDSINLLSGSTYGGIINAKKLNLNIFQVDPTQGNNTNAQLSSYDAYLNKWRLMSYLAGNHKFYANGSNLAMTIDSTLTSTFESKVNLKGSLYINKDSLPVTGGVTWGLIQDTTTGRIGRQPISFGSVTSVAAGTGMSFTTITSSGTINADTTVLSTKANVTATALGKQAVLSGTGFVKAVGSTISYDNSTYYKSGDNVSFGTGSFSGLITSTLGNNTNIFHANSATTGYQFMDLKTTSGWNVIAVESATAGSLVTGSRQNSALFGSFTSAPAHIFQAGVVGLTVTQDTAILNGVGKMKKVISYGATPTIAAGSTNVIGSTGAVSISGTDLAMSVTITTSGTPPNVQGVAATVTFNAAYPSAPHVVMVNNADGSAGDRWEVSNITTTGFSINTVSVLNNSSTHKVEVIIIQ